MSSQAPLHDFLPSSLQIEQIVRHESMLSWTSVPTAGNGVVAAAAAGLGFCRAHRRLFGLSLASTTLGSASRWNMVSYGRSATVCWLCIGRTESLVLHGYGTPGVSQHHHSLSVCVSECGASNIRLSPTHPTPWHLPPAPPRRSRSTCPKAVAEKTGRPSVARSPCVHSKNKPDMRCVKSDDSRLEFPFRAQDVL